MVMGDVVGSSGASSTKVTDVIGASGMSGEGATATGGGMTEPTALLTSLIVTPTSTLVPRGERVA